LKVFVTLALALALALTLLGLRSELPVIAALGPVSAYRCLHSPYRYDPRATQPDRTIIQARPDEHLENATAVEVDLQTGQAIVTTPSDVYVLEPAQLAAIWTDQGLACNVSLKQWFIIAEHHLG
jgi:hypothetical protein